MACFSYEGLMEDDECDLLKAHIQVENGYQVSEDRMEEVFRQARDEGEEGTIRIFFEASGKVHIYRG